MRGKRVVPMDGAALRVQAAAAGRVIIDIGAGDGRWIYRLARSRPDWLCVAVDANAGGLRHASRKAGRKPSRGGAVNAWFLRASAEALPSALAGLADEIHIHLPWGSLLRGLLDPQPAFLAGIARLGKPGAVLSVRVNRSVLDDPLTRRRLGLRGAGHEITESGLAGPYAAAGIDLKAVRLMQGETITTWGRRVGRGRLPEVLAIDGRVKENFLPQGLEKDAAQSAGNRWMPPAVPVVRQNLQQTSENADDTEACDREV